MVQDLFHQQCSVANMQFKLKRLLHDPLMAEGEDQSTLATGVFFKSYEVLLPHTVPRPSICGIFTYV